MAHLKSPAPAGSFRVRRFARNAVTLAALGGVLSAAVPAAASASTAARPSVRFSFASNGISTGTAPQVRYSARNLPGGSHLYLQWQYGSGGDWAYVQSLPGRAGTARLPADPVGVYRFRVRALDGPAVVAVSGTRTLWVTQSSGCEACQILEGLAPVAAALIGVLF